MITCAKVGAICCIVRPIIVSKKKEKNMHICLYMRIMVTCIRESKVQVAGKQKRGKQNRAITKEHAGK